MIVKHAARKPGTRDRLVGLMAYLAGPGTREEHSDQRIIAAWDPTVTDIEIREPSEQMDLAHEMEFPARIREMEPPKNGFVYHVPISLHADDPRLSDEQWGYVARKAIDKLGFGDCRWIAVHHGLARSEQGPRDHIHLVVHLAQENGTIASTWGDYKKMAELRAEMEDDPTLGLRVKTQRGGGGREGWRQGERYRAERAGRGETDREQLERLVRAAAGPAESEADWVGLMRSSGVLVRARYAPGGRSEVVGYSVALAPEAGAQPVWYGGGRLARDLSLTAIRRRWDGHDPAASLGAWSKNATLDARRPLVASSWSQAHRAVADFERLALATPLSDTVSWRAYARETAEALAGLSTRAPQSERIVLQRAATQLSRVAEMPHGQLRGVPSRGATAMRAACRVITSAAIAERGGMTAVIQLTVQLARLSAAVRRANEASQAAAAARMSADAEANLLAMHHRLQASTVERRGGRAAQLAADASPAVAPSTPFPAPSSPGRSTSTGHGHENVPGR
ncbi:relaxase/mobilization nuclease domain-containing protein [Prauserella endophytica]|uniref:MobA/VirD2-like nuclease domain-containing protein n=1 Tax=Prauserella endophytica TaxID=1592324 RepID=A0ABY2RUZ4_9PSEU|nr:hypothetical protein [Prauserella endophytica]TKG61537.1 hypothetical protein FCN18_33400 [Prauserella endophytica]